MSKLNAGDVTITLAGEERVLKPTMRAANMISSHFNGLAKAREQLVAQDLQAVTAIIRHGLNLSDKDAKNLPEQIWETGVGVDLLIPLIRFVGVLANGGKPLPDDPGAGDESTEGNAASD